jgi:hypothetical protein
MRKLTLTKRAVTLKAAQIACLLLYETVQRGKSAWDDSTVFESSGNHTLAYDVLTQNTLQSYANE